LVVTAFYIFSSGYFKEGGSLTIYTYSSLLKYGSDPNATYDVVFGAFEREHGINITVKYFSDSGDLLPALISEKNAPKADIVIGLTGAMGMKAKQEKLLQQYVPSNVAELRQSLIASLDPEDFLTPYEFGLIAIDVDSSYVNESSYPGLASIGFDDLLSPHLSRSLIVENPTTSSVGQDFLLSQIIFYEKVLKADWRQWWRSIRSDIKVMPGWDDAFSMFSSGNTDYHMVVSYATDPAYSSYFNYPTYQTLILQHNGTRYGWEQILGIGIISNAPHLTLAKSFVDWFLDDTVQEEIPLNEWMYPANEHTWLPDVYRYAVNPDDIKPLNDLVSADELYRGLTQWMEEWQSIMAGLY
jgi:thiamine transport system substrate-binding protein